MYMYMQLCRRGYNENYMYMQLRRHGYNENYMYTYMYITLCTFM